MFSRFFIERPRFAVVISIVLVLCGLVSLRMLPVEEYPEIAPPTLFVSTNYAGASAEVISQTVAIPIEDEINGLLDAVRQSDSAKTKILQELNDQETYLKDALRTIQEAK